MTKENRHGFIPYKGIFKAFTAAAFAFCATSVTADSDSTNPEIEDDVFSVAEKQQKDQQDENGAYVSDYSYRENYCTFSLDKGTYVIYSENDSGVVNYYFVKAVNLKTVAKFSNGQKFIDSESLMCGFPTPESRERWSSAMKCACDKMIEWIVAAEREDVERVSKMLPAKTFKNGVAYATVDLIGGGPRQSL